MRQGLCPFAAHQQSAQAQQSEAGRGRFRNGGQRQGIDAAASALGLDIELGSVGSHVECIGHYHPVSGMRVARDGGAVQRSAGPGGVVVQAGGNVGDSGAVKAEGRSVARTVVVSASHQHGQRVGAGGQVVQGHREVAVGTVSIDDAAHRVAGGHILAENIVKLVVLAQGGPFGSGIGHGAGTSAAESSRRQGDSGASSPRSDQGSGSIGITLSRGNLVHFLSGFSQIRAVHNGGAIA